MDDKCNLMVSSALFHFSDLKGKEEEKEAVKNNLNILLVLALNLDVIGDIHSFE